ncbi:MAG: dTDP-4-dehydrorhamnose 3,5-epimerase [Candidatus Competibacteraceae bacterium]|nr:dTDP-4-dehydrorhamnose 3,5-epimerase [Candidatus Competibacteraceae bacterium]
MIFHPTPLAGVWLIEPQPMADRRGFFARTFCAREFAQRGLNAQLSQCSISHNRRRGVLRGLHYQAQPLPEAKLVRCSRGRIFDVAVDLRPASPTRGQWFAAELDADNRRALYIPEGCAHGFQTLVDDSEVFYQISADYRPQLSRGIRWDDPTLAIRWPLPGSAILSERDRTLPLLQEVLPC